MYRHKGHVSELDLEDVQLAQEPRAEIREVLVALAIFGLSDEEAAEGGKARALQQVGELVGRDSEFHERELGQERKSDGYRLWPGAREDHVGQGEAANLCRRIPQFRITAQVARNALVHSANIVTGTISFGCLML